MTPEAATFSYRRFLTDRVTVTRPGGLTVENVPARCLGYSANELSATIMQGDQKIILLASFLEDKGYLVPVKRGDVVVVQDKTGKVQYVDMNTRKVGTTVIAYECQVRG